MSARANQSEHLFWKFSRRRDAPLGLSSERLLLEFGILALWKATWWRMKSLVAVSLSDPVADVAVQSGGANRTTRRSHHLSSADKIETFLMIQRFGGVIGQRQGFGVGRSMAI